MSASSKALLCPLDAVLKKAEQLGFVTARMATDREPYFSGWDNNLVASGLAPAPGEQFADVVERVLGDRLEDVLNFQCATVDWQGHRVTVARSTNRALARNYTVIVEIGGGDRSWEG